MKRRFQRGFALPTVVITGTVLFTVIMVILGSTASTRTVLDAQFYEALARDAAESGARHAEACIKANGWVATWSDASPLRPNTSCSGGAACTTGPNCYVAATSSYKSTYSVGAVLDRGGGTQEYTVSSGVSLLRTSDGSTWKAYSSTSRVRTGATINQSMVAFGYSLGPVAGSFFATLGKDGKLQSAGMNNFGQLGDGTTTNRSTPVLYQAPTSNPIVGAYANFLSIGWNLFAVDSAGAAFGSGRNDYGQVGSGVSGSNVLTPQKVVIPNGERVLKVIPNGFANYYLTDANNIYAAGNCQQGALGNGYTISGCTNRSTPVRVALPTPNVSDPNTIPTDNIVTDRYTAYVRMASGRVYGWGDNSSGQLGMASYASSSTPVIIGSYGAANQPKAVRIVFDGVSLFVLDDGGILNTLGDVSYGQNGNRTSSLRNSGSGNCLDVVNGNTTSLQLWQCNGTDAQKFTFRADGSIYNALMGLCVENTSGDGTSLRLAGCVSGSSRQVFDYNPSTFRPIRNTALNRCFDNSNADGISIGLYSCNSTDAQYFDRTTTWMSPFNVTGISGGFTAITTDQGQVSAVTTNGEVWSAGVNTTGMFGNGTTGYFVPDPVKFQLPGGVTATYAYSTVSDSAPTTTYKNLFVIGSDGKVYGAGSNIFGQLGNGTTATSQTTPVLMQQIGILTSKAIDVQSGLGTTVIRTSTGTIYTVGNNNFGQLGDGTTTNRSTPYRSNFINQSNALLY